MLLSIPLIVFFDFRSQILEKETYSNWGLYDNKYDLLLIYKLFILKGEDIIEINRSYHNNIDDDKY